MNSQFTRFGVLLLVLVGFATSTIVRSEETAGEKVENKFGDVKTDTKKVHRDMKRKHRKAAGKDNIAKDANDEVKNAGDDLSNTAEKTKRKVD